MVLDEDVNASLIGAPDQLLVVLEKLDGRLGDEDMDAALDGIERNGKVRWVRGEDGDGVAGLEAINGSLVSVGVFLVIGRKGVERGV